MAFELPPLPYAKDALAPHISAETLEYHYGKHHQTYVTNLNKLIDGTEDANASLEEVILEVRRRHCSTTRPRSGTTPSTGTRMSPNGGGEPTGAVGDAINSAFGSYDEFREKFTEAATTQFGSGWAWLVDDGSGLEIMKTANADLPLKHGPRRCSPSTCGSTPTTSTTATPGPKYIETFLDSLVNWDFVAVEPGLTPPVPT